jgi:hypothetical protein
LANATILFTLSQSPIAEAVEPAASSGASNLHLLAPFSGLRAKRIADGYEPRSLLSSNISSKDLSKSNIPDHRFIINNEF